MIFQVTTLTADYTSLNAYDFKKRQLPGSVLEVKQLGQGSHLVSHGDTKVLVRVHDDEGTRVEICLSAFEGEPDAVTLLGLEADGVRSLINEGKIDLIQKPLIGDTLMELQPWEEGTSVSLKRLNFAPRLSGERAEQ